MNKFILLFERLGIPDKTARTYLDLLEHWTSSIAEICLRTGLHRPEAYRILPHLLELGLVKESIRGKRKSYSALSPDRIESLVRDFESRCVPLVSELREKFERLEKNVSVSYREWRPAITATFGDIVDSLPKESVFYRVSAESDVDRANSYLPKDYREKRDRKSLERYVIMSAKTAASKSPRLERELAVVPEGTDGFDQDVSMTVYGDKVAFIDFANESSIVIENPLIAEFQKQLFLLAYRNLKRK